MRGNEFCLRKRKTSPHLTFLRLVHLTSPHLTFLRLVDCVDVWVFLMSAIQNVESRIAWTYRCSLGMMKHLVEDQEVSRQ